MAYFLTQAGADAYSLIKNLAFPKTPKELEYSEIKSLMIDHLKPRTFTLKERATFNSLVRKQGQDIKDFIRLLQRQAAKCEFGNNLQDQLRDRLLAGINDTQLQKKLLLEDSLTFNRAKEICETASSVPIALEDNQPILFSKRQHHSTNKKQDKFPGNVNSEKPRENNSAKASGKCFSCGGPHFRQQCKLRNATCHGCGRTEHIKKVCRQHAQVRVVETAEASHNDELTVLGIAATNRSSHLHKNTS